jgi:hypothetical protein
MDSKGIDPLSVLKAVRRVSEGLQLERLFRGLSFVLHEWCKFGLRQDISTRVRKGRHGKPDKGQLTAIEFDKLINVVCRTWTKLFQTTGLPLLDQIEKLDEVARNKIVRFKPPVDEFPGLHGPGEARRKKPSGRIVYVVSMLKALAEIEDIPYFTFHPRYKSVPHRQNAAETSEKTPFLLETNELPTRDEIDFDEITKIFGIESSTFVTCGLHVTKDPQFWSGFTDREASFLRDMANALKHLGPTELRALGTHKDNASTLEEVYRELKWANEKIPKIAATLAQGSIELKDAQRFHMSIDEAIRKSGGNRRDYENGYSLVLKELEDEFVRDAFKQAQQAATEVWRDAILPNLAAQAIRMLGLAQYVHGLAYFQKNIRQAHFQSGHLGQLMLKQFTEGLSAVSKNAVGRLPKNPVDAFEKSGMIKKDVASLLINLLNSQTTSTQSEVYHSYGGQ